ncbi:hypothetical protein DSM19430T_32460 [Desulfovibrio psychrotolerans]|uniref:Uncharacterized protein n=1 Tax=Desulfovibrio psychrotolerans TaxID=415242 RepID=A0A7J0BZG2_9BACT|nr:hypothetical protein DSM19430T_32460 [Desulfovibrio psychrotolerans]
MGLLSDELSGDLTVGLGKEEYYSRFGLFRRMNSFGPHGNAVRPVMRMVR